MANQKKSTRDRVQEIAETVRLDDNGTPVLRIEIRFYRDRHLFLRGYTADDRVASALGCNDLAEAIVHVGDIVRRANGKAKKLLV